MAGMETDSGGAVYQEQEEEPGRWRDVQKLLTRGSPLAHPDFEPSDQTHTFLRDMCRLLVIGAGGLGCELLKDLALLGFTKIDVIDMDTIDISNLNRQFLFTDDDIGKPKAEVAAAFINDRVSGCGVTPHFAKIQDFDMDFYKQFHIIVCGLDSIIARRWINGMVLSLLRYDDNGDIDQSSIIPLIDGGTEGFKGNARVIIPGLTACIDCTLDLYPPQVNYPLCTIASKPRLPEHCVEYVKILLWPKEKPFGDGRCLLGLQSPDGVVLDGDNTDHIQWVFDRAQERAREYDIQGVTYRLTKGVVKRIIPAVASTNAAIAAVCATEVFKLATSCSKPMQNYMVFNDTDGVYTYTFEAEKKEDCMSCSTRPTSLTFTTDTTLQQVYDYLKDNQNFLMKAPSMTTVISGKNKTLYMPTLEAVEKATRPNLKQKLIDLGVTDGHQVVVADVTSPKPLLINIKLEQEMDA